MAQEACACYPFIGVWYHKWACLVNAWCNHAASLFVFHCFYVSIAAVVYEEENNTAVDVLSRSKQLSCTPVVSCNETGNVSWSTTSGATNMFNDENIITADVKQYGTYTCYAAGDTTGLVYHAYGKILWQSVLCCFVCLSVWRTYASGK